MNSTKIKTAAREIIETCEAEYADLGDEALWQMAVDMKWVDGWSDSEIEALKRELGF